MNTFILHPCGETSDTALVSANRPNPGTCTASLRVSLETSADSQNHSTDHWQPWLRTQEIPMILRTSYREHPAQV